MTAAVSPDSKWSDNAFLDRLRDATDPLADACARDLPPDQSLAFMFTKMRTDADLPPEAELPEAFATFLRDARPSLDLSDMSEEEHARLRQGQEVFLTHGLASALVLLHKSLQEGYQAPRLAKVLMLSGELETQTYRRVLGVLQMVVRVSQPGSFDSRLESAILPSSDAGLEAVKVRLMHAGIRAIAHREYPDFARQLGGEPIGLEDMLATLMAFSVLVLDGLETLKVALSDEDAEAFFFVWRVYARTAGIHPPGEPKSWDWVPSTLADARQFYEAYQKRHYRPALENAAGLALAAANVRMLNRYLPPLVPRIYMHTLMGAAACEALAVAPVRLLWLWKAFWMNLPRVWSAMWQTIDKLRGSTSPHSDLTLLLLQKLIVMEYRGDRVTYRVPRQLDDIHQIVRGTTPGLEVGSNQFKNEVFPVELSTIRARREALRQSVPDDWTSGPPRADRGLVGLALSGGGIRSATFSLGAIQALASRGGLKAVDYLSTVSGGGYTGAAISSLLNDPDARPYGKEFPLNFEGGDTEPPAMRHIRSGAKYLAGSGVFNTLRIPAILLRGLVLNVALITPYLMLAALATMISFPIVHESDLVRFLFWPGLAALLTVIGSYPIVMWWTNRTRTWEQRNRGEFLLTFCLSFFITALCISFLSAPVRAAITTSWMRVRTMLLSELVSPVDSADIWKWAVVAAAIAALLQAGKLAESASRLSSRVFLYMLGAAAPLAAFATYLLLLVLFARSPYMNKERADLLTAASERTPPLLTDTIVLQELQANGVEVDAGSRVHVDSTVDNVAMQWTISAGAMHTYSIIEVGGMFRMRGVEYGRGLARLARAAGERPDDSRALSDNLVIMLDSVARLGGRRAVIRDRPTLARLSRLGVIVNDTSRVAVDSIADGQSIRWKVGDYRLELTDLGLVLCDAMLGSVESLGPILRDSTRRNALQQVMRARGADLSGVVTRAPLPNDSAWIIHSGEVTDYVVRREGGTFARRARSGPAFLPDWTWTMVRAALPRGRRDEFLRISGVGFGSKRVDWIFVVATFCLLLAGLLVLDVNVTSPHGFWRDRLSQVFLIRARRFGRPVQNDALRLSELGTLNPAVPYHLINTSLNLGSSRVEDLPGRGSDFFLFSRHYVGSFSTGYCHTRSIEAADRHIDLGTAMAISSAAVAPNAGSVTIAPLVPILTVLNVRQDYWAPNPWFVDAKSLVRRVLTRTLTPGPIYLFREAGGLLHARGRFVNLSDGGHIENLGAYELLRRRCRLIVAVDAEHDPEMACPSLAKLARFARIDLGVEISIDLKRLARTADGTSPAHWAIGKIKYANGETGWLLYVKTSVTGDEPTYVMDYRRNAPAFPQEPTADRFFNEAQFEAYRALGYHAMEDALRAVDVDPANAAIREALRLA